MLQQHSQRCLTTLQRHNDVGELRWHLAQGCGGLLGSHAQALQGLLQPSTNAFACGQCSRFCGLEVGYYLLNCLGFVDAQQFSAYLVLFAGRFSKRKQLKACCCCAALKVTELNGRFGRGLVRHLLCAGLL